ncbi:hypothetical protein T261_7280 [Streptomyces lydicus]|nr:hypothetical protein T261_7280 [Streptomyces lydicus]
MNLRSPTLTWNPHLRGHPDQPERPFLYVVVCVARLAEE